MRFHSSGSGAESSLGLKVGRGVWLKKWAPCWKESFFMEYRTVPTCLSSPIKARLLSPRLLQFTIWSITCLLASYSRKSPPWPPTSFLLSAPANNPSHHAKTHTNTPPKTLLVILIILQQEQTLAMSRKERDGYVWQRERKEENPGSRKEEYAMAAAASVWDYRV